MTRASDRGRWLGVAALVSGLLAFAFLPVTLWPALKGAGGAWRVPLMLVPFACALVAIACGALGLGRAARLGYQSGRLAAILGLLLGLGYASLFFALPLLVVLLAFLLLGNASPAAAPVGAPGEREWDGCCSECCVPCCDSACGACCGGCGCGDCGCGGCDCGCGCIVPSIVGGVAAAPSPSGRSRADRAFAHHPDGPEFAADVYRVRGVRLCVGCFTTFPVFLASVAGFAYASVTVPWSVLVVAGLAGAGTQALSSAGLARRRWQKVSVKVLLGSGLAAFVVGIVAGPWAPLAKAGVLLAALVAAGLSAAPRARRLRAACACHGNALDA